MEKEIFVLTISNYSEGVTDVKVYNTYEEAFKEMECGYNDFIENYDFTENIYFGDWGCEFQEDDIWTEYKITKAKINL